MRCLGKENEIHVICFLGSLPWSFHSPRAISFHFFYQRCFHSLPGRLFISSRLPFHCLSTAFSFLLGHLFHCFLGPISYLFHCFPAAFSLLPGSHFIAYPPRFHSFSGTFLIAFWLPFHIYFIVSLLHFHCFPAPISLLIHRVFISSQAPFSLLSGSHFISISLFPGSHFIAYPLRFHSFSGAFFIAFRVPFHIYYIVSLPHFHCFPAPISLLICCVFIPSQAPFSLLPGSHFISISLFPCCIFIASRLPFHFLSTAFSFLLRRLFHCFLGPISYLFHCFPAAFSLLPSSHFIAYLFHLFLPQILSTILSNLIYPSNICTSHQDYHRRQRRQYLSLPHPH